MIAQSVIKTTDPNKTWSRNLRELRKNFLIGRHYRNFVKYYATNANPCQNIGYWRIVELTADASKVAIGTVLSLEGKPITSFKKFLIKQSEIMPPMKRNYTLLFGH